MGRLAGMWVYQSDGDPPDPGEVARRAQRHGMRWLSAQAVVRGEVVGGDWLAEMRTATRARGLRMAVSGYVGRPSPAPADEARAMARAIDLADADFAIVDAEDEYENSDLPVSQAFVDAYRALKPQFRSYLSSFGRPSLHAKMNWNAWARARFAAMPQAYENLNAEALTPVLCVEDYAAIFPRRSLRVTVGCFTEHNHPHLPIPRLVASVREVPRIAFNVYRNETVTEAELEALAAVR